MRKIGEEGQPAEAGVDPGAPEGSLQEQTLVAPEHRARATEPERVTSADVLAAMLGGPEAATIAVAKRTADNQAEIELANGQRFLVTVQRQVVRPEAR